MKIHGHTKKQLISLGVMILIFIIAVLYSIGYFDFTFITRPTDMDTPPSTQRPEYTTSPEESAYEDDYFGEEFGEHFEEYEDYFSEYDEFFGDYEQEFGY